jgi:hypothetical protein
MVPEDDSFIPKVDIHQLQSPFMMFQGQITSKAKLNSLIQEDSSINQDSIELIKYAEALKDMSGVKVVGYSPEVPAFQTAKNILNAFK